jgi:hypothetical protein
MRVLGAVVQALVLSMLTTWHHDPFRSGIAGQFIGDHHAWRRTLPLEQLAQQALRRFGIATTLDQNVEYGPVLIDGAPELMLSARDADHNLVEVPFVSRCGKSVADPAGKALAELQGPLPDGLVTDLDASGSQHLLDHAQAQGKPKVQPDGVADHFSREAVASVARRMGVLHPSPMPLSGHSAVNLTVPYRQSLDQVRQQATEAADAASSAVSTGALLAALGLILGAVAAWFGGRMGTVEPTITARFGLGRSAATEPVVHTGTTSTVVETERTPRSTSTTKTRNTHSS